MNDAIIARPELQAEISRTLENYRAIYIGGATGWGKSTSVKLWLESNNTHYKYFTLPHDKIEWDVESQLDYIVIDDVQALSASDSKLPLCDALNKLGKQKMILIGRGAMPSFLSQFIISGICTVIDISRFGVAPEHIGEYFAANAICADAQEVACQTKGYPIAVWLIIRRLRAGESFSHLLLERTRLDLYICYDELVYARMDERIRLLLLHMSPFKSFTLEMVEMVTGFDDAAALLSRAVNEGSYLLAHGGDAYEIPELMGKYLNYKQKRVCPADFIAESYNNAGLYYETRDDIINAMDCYEHSGNLDKICELLMLDSKRNPGNGHYYASESFYMSLPRERVLASPELMCGMSMLHSVMLRPEESNLWYNELEKYCKAKSTNKDEMRKAQGLMAYLQIALPHLGTRHTASYILNATKLIKMIHMPDFSVTSGLPSIMNGGKDFCRWTRHDTQLYRILKRPCEVVLGKYGVGMPEIALAESMFIKGYGNMDRIMALLNMGIETAATRGTPEMVFAGTAILMSLMVSSNNISEARRLMDGLNMRIKPEPLMKGNMLAYNIWLNLLEGQTAQLEEHFEQMPDERNGFYILYRFQYSVKVRMYIQRGQLVEAVSLLTRLMNYYDMYDRIYGRMEGLMLLAICQYRMDNPEWQNTLNRSLIMQQEYDFVRVAAEDGAAIWELMHKAQLKTNPQFTRRISEVVKRYAVMYPKYLRVQKPDIEPLTSAEKGVLHLIRQGLANDEIAETLNISMRTVKFHVGNVYAKLGVKGRLQAIERARALNL